MIEYMSNGHLLLGKVTPKGQHYGIPSHSNNCPCISGNTGV